MTGDTRRAVLTPYYLPTKLAQPSSFTPRRELRRQKHRDLQVPFLRGGRCRGHRGL